MRRINFLLVLWMMLVTTAFAVTDKAIYSDDKAGIIVEAKQPEFVIKVESNPSTGYSWFLQKYDSTLIEPVKHEYQHAANRKLVGAPGYELWTFRMKSTGFNVPQQTKIYLVYARPWEGMAEPAKQMVFHIATISSVSTSHSQKPR